MIDSNTGLLNVSIYPFATGFTSGCRAFAITVERKPYRIWVVYWPLNFDSATASLFCFVYPDQYNAERRVCTRKKKKKKPKKQLSLFDVVLPEQKVNKEK